MSCLEKNAKNGACRVLTRLCVGIVFMLLGMAAIIGVWDQFVVVLRCVAGCALILAGILVFAMAREHGAG